MRDLGVEVDGRRPRQCVHGIASQVDGDAVAVCEGVDSKPLHPRAGLGGDGGAEGGRLDSDDGEGQGGGPGHAGGHGESREEDREGTGRLAHLFLPLRATKGAGISKGPFEVLVRTAAHLALILSHGVDAWKGSVTRCEHVAQTTSIDKLLVLNKLEMHML